MGRARQPHAVALAAALAMAVAPAARAADPAAEVAARAAERGLDEAALLEPLREAERRGLPVRPVADKVLEGIAKGVPPDRVSAVAGALVARLGEAGVLLEASRALGLPAPADRDGALLDLAHALGGGVDRTVFETLAGEARRVGGKAEDAVAAASALGTLARRGVPAGDAMALGRALVSAPRRAREVGPAFDAWRAHGGRDVAGFLSETERRVRGGGSLSDLDREPRGRAGREAGEPRGPQGAEGRRGRHP